jgi:hypothetical protein
MGMIDVVRCALCGSTLTLIQGIDEEGVTWTQQRCECGRTDFLHIDAGKLDLGLIEADPGDDYEIFESPF